MFRIGFKLFLWYWVILLFGESGDIVFPCQFLLCKITLLHFTDDEANVLRSVKHLAAFGWGHRQIPELEADGVLCQNVWRQSTLLVPWMRSFLLVVVISCQHCDSMWFIIQDGWSLNYFVCYTLRFLIGLLDSSRRKTEKNKSEFSFILWWGFPLKGEEGCMKTHLN